MDNQGGLRNYADFSLFCLEGCDRKGGLNRGRVGFAGLSKLSHCRKILRQQTQKMRHKNICAKVATREFRNMHTFPI